MLASPGMAVMGRSCVGQPVNPPDTRHRVSGSPFLLSLPGPPAVSTATASRTLWNDVRQSAKIRTFLAVWR